MSTGSLAAGVCFENVSLATDAYFSGLPPLSSYVSGSYVFSPKYESVGGVWSLQSYASPVGGGGMFLNSSVAVPVPLFPACYAPSESFADGVNIGWSVAGVLILVVFVYMARSAMVSRG